jgi:hypothetical protein
LCFFFLFENRRVDKFFRIFFNQEFFRVAYSFGRNEVKEGDTFGINEDISLSENLIGFELRIETNKFPKLSSWIEFGFFFFEESTTTRLPMG